jgi:hypothetical protein
MIMKAGSRKQGIVWGGLLILFGIMALVEVYTDLSPWIWFIVLALAGSIVLLVFLTDRSDYSLLLATYILWVIAGLIALLELNILSDPWVPLYVLSAIALPFLVVYFRDRNQWWALIPAYVLLAVGLMVLLLESNVLSDLLVPAYVMFAIAIPFLVVFANNRKNWWALIPGGILVVIGTAFLIAEAALEFILPVVFIILGIGIMVRVFTRKESPEVETPMVEPEVEEPPTE